ncbi:hypothetical protein [Pseudomonas sp. Irchel s3a12]|uniref:hypothetical protein n=1 Tax=Pseudomonas sp. Irchel s3a12 TaxID=2009047 RepID=UPI000BA31F70|nr:hypothetical protein [Pseudomonas sp. Irchel s3a12]
MDVWQWVSQVADWLVERHASRRGSTYNYMYFVSAAAAVGSWVVAKELLAKRKALKANVSETLQNETLRAMSFAQEDGRPVKRTATLVRQEDTFFVTVIRHDDEERVESSSEALHSLDDVDVYLRDHTPFILADFRAS